MNPYLLGLLAAVVFLTVVAPVVWLLAPFVAQILSDARRQSWVRWLGISGTVRR